jgi:uncharacterized protein YjiS (DUF1127 family)
MTHAHRISSCGRPVRALGDRAGGRIAQAWRSYWQWRTRRAAVDLLHSLDDRTLRDIGVGRSEITSVVDGRPCDRTRHYNEAWRLWHAGN